MKKMILGTVQLGLNYGINNQSGMPDMEESRRILDYAYHNGIDCLDTAEDYGTSEQVIGQFIRREGKSFSICTKLSSGFDCSGEDIYDRLQDRLKASKQRLAVENIYVYYLHAFLHCRNRKLMDALVRLKEEGAFQLLGVSIYEPSELEYLMENCTGIIDVVQLPFNILDHARWIMNDLLSRARDKKFMIFVRSVLLQGLLFKNENDEIINRLGAAPYLKFLKELAARKNTDVISAAYSFVNQIDQIDAVLMGCETKNQLQFNIELRKKKALLDQADMEKIFGFYSCINEDIIDPRRW